MAGFELRRLRGKLQEQDEQRNQLDGYRSEYSKRLYDVGKAGLNVAQLRNYHLFFRDLNNAIDQQDLTIESYHAHLEEGEAHWRQQYRKASSLDKAVDRINETEKKESDRKSELSAEEAVYSYKAMDRRS